MSFIKKTLKFSSLAIVFAGLLNFFMLTSVNSAEAVGAKSTAEGKKLTFGRKKGNCLACHIIADGSLPGNVGPPLVAMKVRFKTKKALRSQIANSRARNKLSIMPPFSAKKILTEKEIDLITDFIYTL
ncbi:MAG: sulfur oxidation c-type cytochrome SoxX [Gammaproteobacteria bacterium]|nr:MAG: sulfur oxidation c-type cytochrome SoxX [Gammaproteobacteria bacterium]